jgi:hypothetical protein
MAMIDFPHSRDGHIFERFMLYEDLLFLVEDLLLEDWALRQRGRVRASALS